MNVFGKEEKEKLIEFLMQGDISKCTALHRAAQTGHEGIVNSLLKVFVGKKDNDELIEFLLKKNKHNHTALSLASQQGNKKIKKLLSQKLTKATK